MSASAQPPAPFRFQTSLILQEATGLRAATLPQLAALLRQVPEGCIYYHTHYFLLAYHYLTPPPGNDLAYWVAEVLGEEPLGEWLAGIDIMAHASLASLRDALAGTVDTYLTQRPTARLKFVSEGEEFFFIKPIQVVLPTPYTAATLEEFIQALERITIHSLSYHMFDARLRLGRPTNDVAAWLEGQGLQDLAARVAQMDPYAYTLETLRGELVSMIREALPTHA